jgi:hypothetical protein
MAVRKANEEHSAGRSIYGEAKHPLNGIMAIVKEAPDMLVIANTDIHLPRRIGTAIHLAFHGDLKLHFRRGQLFHS